MEAYARIYRQHSTPLLCRPTGVAPVLPQFTGIKSVIFDIYGTLFISGSGDIGVHSASQQEETLRNILTSEFDLNLDNASNYTQRLLSSIQAEHQEMKARGIEFPEIDIREHWKKLFPALSDEQIDALAVRYETISNPVWPMPNALETLIELDRRDLHLGIISNAQFYTPALFPAFFGDQTPNFPTALYSYHHREAKPGLELYHKTVARLEIAGIKPAEVLYVGNDMRNDIHPGRAVGFKTVLLASDLRSYRPREEMKLPRADATITDLNQIIDLLVESH